MFAWGAEQKKTASLRVLRGWLSLPRLPLHSPPPCAPAAAKQARPEKGLGQGITLNIIFIMQKKLKKQKKKNPKQNISSFSFLDVKSSEILKDL